MTALPVNPSQLAELWQQVRASAEERSKDFGDVALQYHLAEQLGLVELLDQVAGKRAQGLSVGLATLMMAIHRNSDPGSKLAFLEWYPTTILPELSGQPANGIAYHDLLASMDYWIVVRTPAKPPLPPSKAPSAYARSSTILPSGSKPTSLFAIWPCACATC